MVNKIVIYTACAIIDHRKIVEIKKPSNTCLNYTIASDFIIDNLITL